MPTVTPRRTRCVRKITLPVLFGACLGLTSSVAAADGLENKFGSDAENAQSFLDLLQRDVHFDASAGLWLAQLSGGLTTLSNTVGSIGYSEDATTVALDSVGTGHGLIREVKFGLEVKGNEAYFDYLSDKLFQTAEEEIDRNVDNPILREALLQIAGELRPDLKSLLGPDAKVWLRAEYGEFKGVVENGHIFSSKNGKPFFGRREEPWETDYFGFEAGVYPEGRLASDELKKRVGIQAGDEGFGFYARVRRFSRPLVLGFGSEGPDIAQFMLVDGAVTAYELGARVEFLNCNKVVCLRTSGYMAPFTGYTHVEYEGIGDAGGGLVTLGGELKLSLPIELGDTIAFAPYVGFRTDYMLPFVSSSTDSANDSSEFNEALEPWAIDYFFWGPNAGLMVKM